MGRHVWERMVRGCFLGGDSTRHVHVLVPMHSPVEPLDSVTCNEASCCKLDILIWACCPRYVLASIYVWFRSDYLSLLLLAGWLDSADDCTRHVPVFYPLLTILDVFLVLRLRVFASLRRMVSIRSCLPLGMAMLMWCDCFWSPRPPSTRLTR